MLNDKVFEVPYLKCVRELPSCDGIEVGDLLWKRRTYVAEGGYEYAELVRRGDLRVFRARLDALDGHFEVERVDETLEWVMRTLAPLTVAQTGCGGMSYSGRFRHVTVESR